MAERLAFGVAALPGHLPGAPRRDVIAAIWPDAGVAVDFAPALNGLPVHAEDGGELDRVLGVFVGGRGFASERGLKQVALGCGEGFTLLNLLGDIAEVAFEQDGGLLGSERDLRRLCVMRVAGRSHLTNSKRKEGKKNEANSRQSLAARTYLLAVEQVGDNSFCFCKETLICV